MYEKGTHSQKAETIHSFQYFRMKYHGCITWYVEEHQMKSEEILVILEELDVQAAAL